MEKKGKKFDILGKEKKLKSYRCKFCGHEFQQYVSIGGKKGKEGKRGNVSSQVKCSKCGNFMKTWSD